MHKLRPDAAKSSISVYINQNDQFARVGNAIYALSSWRLAAKEKKIAKKGVCKQIFSTAVRKILDGRSEVGFPELIKGVMNETDLSEASVRQRLLKENYLDVRQEKGKKYKIVRFIKDDTDIDSIQTIKIFLRDKVQNEVRSILYDHPNVPYQKSDLYCEVCKNVKCLRPTFYRYLEEIDNIRQYKEGNKYYAIYDHEETHDHIELNIEQFNLDRSVEKELHRALSKLTLEEVDIGLFELGLIFESKLRDFLLKAKSKNIFTVNKKDLGRLVDMINCVIREGVVTKGHHLNTLREERNKRAHGAIPSLNEREDLLNKAHYVAELFVKYIAFFHNKLDEM